MKMKSFFSVLAICIISFHSNGQNFDRKIIPAGEKVSAFSYNLFPSFADGIVKLRDGRSIPTKMNFSLALCEMQFINPKGDTLSLTELENVDSIYLNGSVFFYISKKGYFQIPNDSLSPVRLAILRKTSYEPVKIGAMGSPNRSSAVQDYGMFYFASGARELTVKVDIYVSCRISYYFLGKKYPDMIEASKPSLLKIIIKNNQEVVEEYIKTNKINFSKEKDLQKLLQFCNNLSMTKNEVPFLSGM